MRQTTQDWLVNAALRLLVGLALALPYRARVALMGWLTAHVVAPVAGYNRRSRANLALVFPEMAEAERARIARAAADNAGRTLIEIFSGAEFIERVKGARISGPGMAAVEAARAAGRPVIVVSGHFGNYDVVRAWFAGRGIAAGGLYKPLSNPRFNALYVERITAVNGPLFERGRAGLAQMIAHLRKGGILCLLFDQRINTAEPLDFLGQPALTAFSAAELALRYGADLIPAYGIRDANGTGYELATEAPIPHEGARAMMEALTASLEGRVRAHPEQYFWIHRRWKA